MNILENLPNMKKNKKERKKKDYGKGKIYLLFHNKKLIYVGSTTTTLYTRKKHHYFDMKKENKKNIVLYQYLKTVQNFDEIIIELYEDYPCTSEFELTKREDEVFLEHKEKGYELLNMVRPNRKKSEYDKDNREKQNEYNREQRKLKPEQYREYDKKKYEKVKDIINEHINCGCGGKYIKRQQLRHEKTQIHIHW